MTLDALGPGPLRLPEQAGEGSRRSPARGMTFGAPGPGPLRLAEQASAVGLGGELELRVGVELVEQIADVMPHGVDADHEALGDVGVVESLADQIQDLSLA